MFSDFGRLHYSSDLRESRQLQDHAMMVMCTIDEAITNLDDLDYVITSLHKVGRSHCRFEGYTPDTFWVSLTKRNTLQLLVCLQNCMTVSCNGLSWIRPRG